MYKTFLREHFSAPLRRSCPLIDDVHPPRRSGLDPILLERFLDAPPHLAADRILLVGTSLDDDQVFRLAIADAIDPRDLNIRNNILGKVWVVANVAANLLQYLHNF